MQEYCSIILVNYVDVRDNALDEKMWDFGVNLNSY